MGLADLSEADLRGADLRGVKGLLSFGQVGSRLDTLFIYIHDGIPQAMTGCFSGTVEKFYAEVAEHPDARAKAEYEIRRPAIDLWLEFERAALPASDSA